MSSGSSGSLCQRNYDPYSLYSLLNYTPMMSLQRGRFSDKMSQWELISKRNSEQHNKETEMFRNIIDKDIKLSDAQCELRPAKTFVTKSKYEGTWDYLGMCGYGKYTFPSGVVYEGEFDDNEFHGIGELRYPNGTVIQGKWNMGKLMLSTLIFADNVRHQIEDWKYCKMPDRRFASEYENGIPAAGFSNLTATLPTRDIPEGWYDVGDGFYNPASRVVYQYEDLTRPVRFVKPDMHNWILANCRKNPFNDRGPKPELYEEWVKPALVAERNLPPPCSGNPLEDLFIDALLTEKDTKRVSYTKQRVKGVLSRVAKLTKIKEADVLLK